MALDQSFIQDLLDKLDIETVISSHVSLKRAGKNLKGLCPFHNEKTPSFTVYPDTHSFYCFGCGAGGDVISFIRKIDNLDYMDAVKAAADMAGMSLPEDGYDDSMAKRRMRLLNANREAAKFFNVQLNKTEHRYAMEYYLNRGLTPSTITRFGLGYAPKSWTALTDHLKSLGFTEQELVLANLSRRSEKNGKISYYDNFRNRMMFPVIDHRGNVVAFSGRRYDETEERKYVNTSDTPVFKKGNCIFGLNFAKNSNTKQLIIVEGQMDVISLHQAGFTNAVACLGTALTTEQANLLSRYADEILICYDSDEAGKKATKRALEVLEKTGLHLKVINMTGGKDPDEIIKTYGPERISDLINGASNEIEYGILNERAKYDLFSEDGKIKFLVSVSNILASCSPIQRDVYASKLANELEISKDAIILQIKEAEKRITHQKRIEHANADKKAMADSFTDKNNPERVSNLKEARAEEILIASLMRNPDFYKKIQDKFTPDDYVTSFNKRIIKRLIFLIQNNLSTDPAMFAEDFDPDEMSSISRILISGQNISNTLKECEDCIAVLKNVSGKKQVDPSTLSDNDWAASFQKKNNKVQGGQNNG